MTRSRRLLIQALAWLAAASVLPAIAQDRSDGYPITPMATSWVELHGHRYTVEIAQTEAQRARGLMFRDRLERNHGMLFIHDVEEPLAYWMKNTRIALDIFYFDSGRHLVSVSKRTPPCTLGDGCPPFGSDGPALYVLELNSGIADRLHVKKGDLLTFGPNIHAIPPAQP
jgi:uncharacterized membrane protein (UPF0127 family)